MDKMREDFKSYYKEHMRSQGECYFLIDEQIASFDDGRISGYSDIQEYWLFWKASRAALVVKLPKVHELEYNSNDNPYSYGIYLTNGTFFDSEDLLLTLKEAGIRYE